MSENTGIEWAGSTWNTIIGCTHASEGCRHCYAEGQVHRFGARYDRPTTIKLGRKANALTRLPVDANGKTLHKGAQWTGAVWLLPDVLELPLRRKKPTTYFVNSLADWAHESIVESEQGRRFLAAMFGVMAATPQHTYQLLTKRPEQARKWFEWVAEHAEDAAREYMVKLREILSPFPGEYERRTPPTPQMRFVYDQGSDIIRTSLTGRLAKTGTPECHWRPWPLPNVWLLASIEDQATADKRIDELPPAAVRGVSLEPMLAPVDLSRWLYGERRLNWVIVGGESGPKARPCDVAWIRSIVDQCKAAGIATFVKQLGARPTGNGIAVRMQDAKGGDMAEWPEDLRVREMPGQ